MKSANLTTSRRGVAAFLLAALCLQGALSQAAETAAPPAMLPMAPAGQYRLEKSHASLLLRVNHLGFSTYTTRIVRDGRGATGVYRHREGTADARYR